MGSLGASFNNAIGSGNAGQGGYLNLANAIPWGMERNFVAAKALADKVGGDKNIPSGAIGFFANAVSAVAEPISKVLDFLPNAVRDSTLNSRTAIYKALVTGQHVDPTQTLGTSMAFELAGNAQQRQIDMVNAISDLLAKPGHGGASEAQLAQAKSLVAGMIDLPEDVKRQIEADPNGDLAKMLDTNPEGRQLSYDKGAAGFATNLGGMALLYGLEIMGTGGLTALARGGALAAKASTLANVAYNAPGFGVKALQAVNASRVGQAVITGVSVAQKVQKLALASGISYFPLSILTDTVLRTMGNKDGVAYLDQINRTALVSDNPAVQLVTSFTVDPIGAGKAALKGELELFPGLVIKGINARSLGKVYGNEEAMLDRLASMYSTDRASAADMIGPGKTYETKADAFDQVLGLAGNTVADKLPSAEKMRLNSLSDDLRTKALMGPQYIKRVLYEYDHPTGLVAQFRSDWSYRNFYGEFDPEIAKLVTRDFRNAMLKTAKARAAVDGVVGTVDMLNPEGQAAVAGKIEAAFADGRQGTLRDLNALSEAHPSLDGIVSDLVAKADNGKPITKPTALVPREVFDEALARASGLYETARKDNPVRVATGVDPVLRPGVHLGDWAAAVNTTEDTIKAMGSLTRTPAQDALVKTFLQDKGLVTIPELATATADDLAAKANLWLEQKTAPWVKRGDDVAVLEAEMGKAATRLHDLRRAEAALADAKGYVVVNGRRRGAAPGLGRLYGDAEIAAAEADVAAWRALLADVRDPLVPASAGVKSARRAEGKVMQDARRKVDAMGRVDAIRAIVDTLKPAQDLSMGNLLRSVRKVQGEWRWAADERVQGGPVFDAAVNRYKAFMFEGRANTHTAAARFDATPPAGQAAEMAASKGFEKALSNRDALALGQNVTNGEIADMLASGRTAEVTANEITPEMIAALGVADRPSFIAQLGSMREAYDAALSGKAEAAIGRTASIKVPDWAVQRALKGETASLWRDPLAEVAHTGALHDLKAALDSDAFPAVRPVIEGDPLLRAQARELAAQKIASGGVHGWNLGDFLTNPANRDAIRTLLPDQLPERGVPGVPLAETELGQAILAGDEAAPALLKIKLDEIQSAITEPLKDVPVEAVDALASAPRLSVKLADDLDGMGIHWNAPIPETLWAKSEAGKKALSVILNLNFHRPPQTIHGLLTTLKEIENGHAAAMGVGPQLAAEAQRLGEFVVQSMIGDARRAGLEMGVLGMGKYLNPRTWNRNLYDEIKKLFAQNRENGSGMLVFKDEMGLQYGIKARPKGRKNAAGEFVPANPALDMGQLPAGFAEELLTGHFQPFSERIVNARTRQAFSRLFHIDNQQITFEARARFEASLEKQGIPAQAAQRVWTAWRDTAKESRQRVTGKDAEGNYFSKVGDSARYATEKNIPNGELDPIADKALGEFYARRGGVPDSVRKIKFSEEMRLASSFTRRNLAGLPLGHALQETYGKFAHNEWVTTKYYLFRFALDTRFHAMNKFEGPFLFAGRAGLKTGELSEGLFGMTRDFIKRGQTAGDAMMDTGYPFSVTRDEWLYRGLLKEQPDALRGIVRADPALVEKAVRNIAEKDPELAATIAEMGHTPNDYLRVMDSYYKKIMSSADPEAVVTAELMKDLVNNPELGAVYGRIAEVNNELIGSLRETFYGNPNRGQVERVLNSYLLYWPLSYQIKATKWLVKILYGKVGGVQTGGLGALALDKMASDHEKRLVEDPEYADFFVKHPSLVFAAQMILPISPGSLGVGLNPILRDVFFGGSKNIMEIGPVYTFTKFLPNLAGELYQDIKDVPGIEPLAAAALRTMGRKPPADKPTAAKFAPLQ
jgi:hypothetical protein